MLKGKRMEPVFPGEIVICYNDWLLLHRKCCGKHWSVSVWCVLPWMSSWASALRQFTVQGNMFVKVWMCCAMFMHKLPLACLAAVLCPQPWGMSISFLHRWWLNDSIRPVLKHGPRSLAYVQVHGLQICVHNESDCWDLCASNRPINWERFEYEHIC